MKIRPGIPSDAKDIADLIASSQQELTVEPDGIGAEQYIASVSVEAERGYLESPRYSYLVAERGGTMLGFIALRDITHVFHLFVARQYQRTGVGRRLWHEAKAQALSAAASGQFTVNSSLAAVPVYRAFGFEASGGVVSAHGISFLPMRLAEGANQA